MSAAPEVVAEVEVSGCCLLAGQSLAVPPNQGGVEDEGGKGSSRARCDLAFLPSFPSSSLPTIQLVPSPTSHRPILRARRRRIRLRTSLASRHWLREELRRLQLRWLRHPRPPSQRPQPSSSLWPTFVTQFSRSMHLPSSSEDKTSLVRQRLPGPSQVAILTTWTWRTHRSHPTADCVATLGRRLVSLLQSSSAKLLRE